VVLNVCAIDDPLPAEAPETPDWLTVQLYVVLPKELDNAIEVAVPEQIV
jgi:hypothetical protein